MVSRMTLNTLVSILCKLTWGKMQQIHTTKLQQILIFFGHCNLHDFHTLAYNEQQFTNVKLIWNLSCLITVNYCTLWKTKKMRWVMLFWVKLQWPTHKQKKCETFHNYKRRIQRKPVPFNYYFAKQHFSKKRPKNTETDIIRNTNAVMCTNKNKIYTSIWHTSKVIINCQKQKQKM